MILLPLGIGCGLVVFIFHGIFTSLITRRRCQAEAARRGCMPAPAVPSKGFLGLIRLLDVLKATREERAPQQFVEAMDELGGKGVVHTSRIECESRSGLTQLLERSLCANMIVLGSELLMTRDPENVKAIFGTHASSFEISAHR